MQIDLILFHKIAKMHHLGMENRPQGNRIGVILWFFQVLGTYSLLLPPMDKFAMLPVHLILVCQPQPSHPAWFLPAAGITPC